MKLKFTKMAAAGNDFIVLDNRMSGIGRRVSLSGLAQSLCQRRTGVGADGILVLEKSRRADFKMRIINADGSEAEMCGNGLRCAAMRAYKNKRSLKIEAVAGIYEAEITGKDRVKIKMEDPKDMRLDIDIKVNEKHLSVNYVDSGVPHTVIFVHGLDDIDVDSIGRAVRYHGEFGRRGTNVDFVEIRDSGNIRMRTYERGVEGETLACGTGAMASGIISNRRQGTGDKVNVHTKGGVLRVYLKNKNEKITDVYLEGGAKVVYAGEVDYV